MWLLWEQRKPSNNVGRKTYFWDSDPAFEPPRGKTMWFTTRSDLNRPVQAQKRAISIKFRI